MQQYYRRVLKEAMVGVGSVLADLSSESLLLLLTIATSNVRFHQTNTETFQAQSYSDIGNTEEVSQRVSAFMLAQPDRRAGI